ncbi:hypothetical protein [Aurantiacibacter gilvus]|uniref:Glycerophosphoryl diester phosphodiesterase membrane domain-containing protein n=1 Tax=Aurantiacibacter gilvus TaxID=3139141 RepID=A0ABU9IDQ7_9SPHN
MVNPDGGIEMQVTPPKELQVGRILEVTFDVVERNAVAAVIFIVGLVVVNSAIGYFGVDYSSFVQMIGKQFIAALIGIVAAFLLLVSMLRDAGFLRGAADEMFLPYVGLSILAGLGVIVGFFLIIFPGLYLMARWAPAPSILLSQRKGVIDSMKESWERTGGNEFSIILVVLILVVLQFGVGFAVTSTFDPSSIVGIVIAQLVATGTSVVSTAMGVALYKLLVVDRDGGVGKTFD